MPKFDSLGALVEFFETHDLGGYLEQMPAVDFDVDIRKRTHLFAIDEELADKVTEIAQAKHVPSETLIEVWLREKVLEQAPAMP
jgi:hypothetical protein